MGLTGYSAALVAVWQGVWTFRSKDRLVLILLLLGVTALGISIAIRWIGVGYGPFLTLYEILLSNLFSLGLIYTLVYWRVSAVRAGALAVVPILTLLAIWIVFVPSTPSRLPATYDNILLWIHVGLGKLFLGSCLVAVGMACVLLLRLNRFVPDIKLPAMEVADNLVWRFMSVAFVFHTLMLISGAVWAQDAWGRYWGWDPLETWTFITWLVLGIALHIRVAYKISPQTGWLMSMVVFGLAFLTFFGVPFVSVAPHKGVF